MKTIAERHAEWEALVMPRGASALQRKEMRRAFYSGFHAALIAGLDMADESRDNDDVGATMLQHMHEECRRFALDIAAGKA